MQQLIVAASLVLILCGCAVKSPTSPSLDNEKRSFALSLQKACFRKYIETTLPGHAYRLNDACHDWAIRHVKQRWP